MRLVKVLSILFVSFCCTGTAMAGQIVSHAPADSILFDWATGTMGGSASGYNDGSIMNPGRHWASADDFGITDPCSLPWQLERLTFVCGTDLNAAVDTYRVSVHATEQGVPGGWNDYLWRCEESSSDLVNISVIQTFAGGSRDRWLHEVEVDTTGLDLILESNKTYYISIEGDCTSAGDVYNGYDTYYQRFYMLSAVDGGVSTQINDNHWYTGMYDTGWTSWQEQSSDLVWTIEGHQIPEPCTLSLLVLGGLLLSRHGRK